jgi:branched-chain amino acid transport system substrate-binding protein
VEKKVVKIGVPGMLTGALATIGVPLAYGNIDCGKWLNEQGGLDGIRVEMLWEDTAYMIPRLVSAHKRFKEVGVVLELHHTGGTLETMSDVYVADEMPAIYAGGFSPGMITKPIPWIFTGFSGWAPEMSIVLKYFKEKWTEPRPPRFGFISYDHPVVHSALADIIEYAPKLGIEVVGKEIVPIAVVDSSVEWLRLAGKKPDAVLCLAYGGVMVVVAKDAARLNIQQQGIELYTSWNALDENTLAAVGAEDVEGWHIMNTIPYPEDIGQFPALTPILESSRKYRGYEPQKVSAAYIAAWLQAEVGIEAVRLAIEEVGFENLSGHAVRDALSSIKDFDTGLVPPITMSDKKPYYTYYERIYEIRGGKYICITDWLEPAFVYEF